jgi:GNAT superfamily N-acetyltransferase
VLEEQRLNTKIHNCADFDCGVPELNEYLTRYVSQDRRRNIAQAYVLVDSTQPTEVLGYYAISAAQVDVNQLSEDDQRKLPKYPIPCFRMGRFATSRDVHGKGIGKLLLGCAVDRCLKARQQVAAHALIVDAKDTTAKGFYEHFGFVAFADSATSLYLVINEPG